MVEAPEQGALVLTRPRDIDLILAVTLPLLRQDEVTLQGLTLDVQGLEGILLRRIAGRQFG